MLESVLVGGPSTGAQWLDRLALSGVVESIVRIGDLVSVADGTGGYLGRLTAGALQYATKLTVVR